MHILDKKMQKKASDRLLWVSDPKESSKRSFAATEEGKKKVEQQTRKS